MDERAIVRQLAGQLLAPGGFLGTQARHQLALVVRDDVILVKGKVEKLVEHMQISEKELMERADREHSTKLHLEAQAMQALINVTHLALERFQKDVITDDPRRIEDLIKVMEGVFEARAANYLKILMRAGH